jgi:hypothetical protein
MRCLHSRKLTTLVLLTGLVAAAGAPPALGYPPDNAAVLYYRAFLTYQKPEGAILNNLSAMIADGAAPSDETKKFLPSQTPIIRSMIVASNIQRCDWGYDYSEGFALLMPGLADMRNIARIVLADGLAAMHYGDTGTAADRCITTYRMAQHLKNELAISHLMGIAIEALAKSAMQQILARPVGTDVLTLFRTELDKISLADVSLEHCLRMEMKWVLDPPYDELPAELFAASQPEPKTPQPAIDRAFAQKSLTYYKERMNQHIAVLNLPYSQAFVEINKLVAAIEADAKERPECELSRQTIPSLQALLSLHTRAKTDRNALRAAIEIYLAKARAGKLPKTLPANLPQDMFSGKQFEYEITDTGFTLRCRAANLKSNKVEEYAFAVPK